MKPIRLHSAIEEGRWLVRALAMLSLTALGMAIYEHLTPSTPPFRWRLSWLAELAFAVAGSTGLFVLWLIAALALAVTARSIWRHTPQKPGDRCLY